MAYIFGVRHIVFTYGILCAASLSICAQVQHSDHLCASNLVADCFQSYRASLFSVIYTPDGDRTIRKQIRPETCRILENKSPCHKNLARCPCAVIANFTRQEKGYEGARRIVCDEKAYMDFVIAQTCIDIKEQVACQMQKVLSSATAADAFDIKAAECRHWWAQAACYEKSFKPPCPVPKQTAIDSVKRGYSAAALLTGCDDPNGSDAHAVSLGTLIVLVAVGLFGRTSV